MVKRTEHVKALWRLMRPKGLVFVMSLPLVGYGWGHWDRALPAQSLNALPAVLLAWICFHAGSMWLNAHLDRDDRDVIFGAVGPIPAYLPVCAFCSLTLGVLFSFGAGKIVGLFGLSVAILAWAYSSPRIAWKGHPVWGPLVNGLGYGLISPLAGWWLVGVELNARTVVSWLLLECVMMATYFCLQGYQYDDDRQRGYRTHVVVYGPEKTLMLGRVLLWMGFCVCFSLILAGWYPRLLLLSLPFWFWTDRWIGKWGRSREPEAFVWPVGFAKRALMLGVALISLVSVVYVRDSLLGRPVAGLATVAGLPHVGW